MAATSAVIDRRRVPGPAETFLPVVAGAAERADESLLSASKLRADGRKVDAFREVFMKTEAVPQANGSAYVEMDRTKVICAVYGPRQAQRVQQFNELGQLSCMCRFAPFASEHRRVPQRDPQEAELTDALADALAGVVRLETFPKAVVDVFVTVLEDDGAALAAAINCASLALADAGIEMTDLVAACSAGLLRDLVLIDCTKREEQRLAARLTVAHQPSLNETTYLSMTGEVPPTSVARAVDLCVDGAAKVHALMQESLTTAARQQQQKRKRARS